MDATTRTDLNTSKSRSRAASKIREFSRKEYISGIVLLLVVVFLWTASNFVTQDLFVGGYEKPFLYVMYRLYQPCVLTLQNRVTYLNTSAFGLYLGPFGLRYLWRSYHVGEAAEISR